MKNFIIKNLHRIIFFLILLLVFSGLIFSHGVVMHGDVSENFVKQSWLNFMQYLFSDYGSLNNVENFNRSLFYAPLIFLVQYLNLDITRIFEIIYIFLFGIGLFGMRNLLLYLGKISLIKYDYNTKVNVISIIFSIFFVFSPWAITRNQAYFFVLSLYLLPIIFLYIFKYFDLPKSKYLIIISILLSLIATTPQYFLFTGVLILIAIPFLLNIFDKRFSFLLKPFSLILFLVLILNIHWLYPLYKIYSSGLSISVGYEMTTGMLNFFSQNVSFLKVILGFDSWVDKNILNGGIIRSILLLFLYTLIISFSIKNRDYISYRGKKIVLMLSFLLTFYLGIQIFYNPFLNLLSLLGLNSIGFIFRDMSKLSYVFWFIAPILGFLFFLSEFYYKKSRLYLGVFVIIIFGTTLSISYQRIYSDFYNHFKKIIVPNEYLELNKFFLENDGKDINNSKSIFVAPFYYGMGKNYNQFETSYTWAPNKTASRFIEVSTTKPSIGYYHITFRNWENTLYKKIYPEYSQLDPNKNIPNDIGKNYLAKANIKYLIYHNDIVGAQEKGNEAIKILKNETDLVFVKSFGDFMYLFKNPYVKPILYTANNDQININKINPTKYTFNGYSTGNYLYFAQTYDPFWILSINGKEIKPEKAFDIDLIKYNISGIKNLNGEINYFPQKYYEIGLRISIPFFILLLSYLGYDVIKNKRRRNPKIDISEKSV